MWDGMRAVFRLFSHGSEGARVVALDGVVALVTPATPERSVLNSVLYADPTRLERALGELTDLYADAGIEAWTVWVHPGDRETAGRLEQRGHKLDATPAAMGREIAGAEAHMPRGVEWTREADLAELLRVNDGAYGWAETRPWTRALGGLPPDRARVYLARVDGEPACTLLIYDHAGDCTVWLVATLKPARGRGLAYGLLGQALVDARERGCTTTTLQATKLGEPVYARLGYRSLGTIEMWERRRAP
jgi:GNAT superfamily N-acetyltransferase